jgi:polysaccharide pyruvyl transferase WcaK-like protein
MAVRGILPPPDVSPEIETMNTASPRLLVTGLCMQGNKGGPALALSLAAAIRAEIPAARFVFAVPGDEQVWEHEVKWAARFGFDVCRNAGFGGLLPPLCFAGGRLARFREFWNTLRGCDALVQMSAICYYGPPAGPGTVRAVLASPRWFHFVVSRLARRTMLAWTQSYGPFSTAPIRFFARCDLRRQPIVFCRGDACAEAVRSLLPGHETASFPDVATTLACDPAWGRDHLARRVPALRPFVTLSPSAVMYARGATSAGANRHVALCADACAHLDRLGYDVLLVPHTLRPGQRDPYLCDLAVAEDIRRDPRGAKAMLVDDDLSPTELKSLISLATFHVGARYHSVVAALSAGVPALSLSWHPKYRDLMQTYGLEHFVAGEDDAAAVPRFLAELAREGEGLRPALRSRQAAVAAAVQTNARRFCSLLPRARGRAA